MGKVNWIAFGSALAELTVGFVLGYYITKTTKE